MVFRTFRGYKYEISTAWPGETMAFPLINHLPNPSLKMSEMFVRKARGKK